MIKETPNKKIQTRLKASQTRTNSMKLDELVSKVSERTNLDKQDVRRVFKSTMLEILYSLKKGVSVNWPEMGVFSLRYRKPTTKKMPNGEIIDAPGGGYARLDFSPMFSRSLKNITLKAKAKK